MKRFYFLNQSVITLLLFALVNGGIRILARNMPPRPLLRQMKNTSSMNMLFAGNSLIAAGFDSEVFRKAAQHRVDHLRVSAFNLGVGSTSPIEHLQLVNTAFAQNPRIDLFAYGFFDFQLSVAPEFPIEGNRMLSYYVQPDVAARFYTTSVLERTVFHLESFCPFYVERQNIWKYVEKLRRFLASIGMKEEKENRFGRVTDFSLLEAQNAEVFQQECRNYLSAPVLLSPASEKILQAARRSARRSVLILMPLPSQHRKKFYATPEWKQYRNRLQTYAKYKGVEFVDATEWVNSDTLFADSLHLNAEGSKAFSQRAAETLLP